MCGCRPHRAAASRCRTSAPHAACRSCPTQAGPQRPHKSRLARGAAAIRRRRLPPLPHPGGASALKARMHRFARRHELLTHCTTHLARSADRPSAAGPGGAIDTPCAPTGPSCAPLVWGAMRAPSTSIRLSGRLGHPLYTWSSGPAAVHLTHTCCAVRDVRSKRGGMQAAPEQRQGVVCSAAQGTRKAKPRHAPNEATR